MKRPKATCPFCTKRTPVTTGGFFLRHTNHLGKTCSGSGLSPLGANQYKKAVRDAPTQNR